MEQQALSNLENIIRLNQCYLCKEWSLEKNLQPIEVPDQAGYVRKAACRKCLDKISEKDDSAE